MWTSPSSSIRTAHHPLSAPGGFASATGARLRGAAAVTLRPSDTDPGTRLHGSPGPVNPGNPPAQNADTTLWVCLPRATKTSSATGIPRAGSCRHPDPERHGPRCNGRHMCFPRTKLTRGAARARRGSPPSQYPDCSQARSLSGPFRSGGGFADKIGRLHRSLANPLRRVARSRPWGLPAHHRHKPLQKVWYPIGTLSAVCA